MDEFVQKALQNTDYQVKKTGNIVKFGELDAQPVQIEGVGVDGVFISEPAYLLIAGRGKKLVHIKIWEPGGDYPIKKGLERDLISIRQELKDREIKTQSPANQTSSCIQYKIREGKFASDKCYRQSDYKDLLYYLAKYRQATFDYNTAASQINVTCNGFSKAFKRECENSKRGEEKAKSDIGNYETIIRSIISRGK